MTQNKITEKYQIFTNDKETYYRFYLIAAHLQFVNYVTLYKVDQWYQLTHLLPGKSATLQLIISAVFLKWRHAFFLVLDITLPRVINYE